MNSVSTDQKKIDELLSRSVAEIIDREDLEKKLKSGKQLRVKLGIDPTSPNIHIGRSIPLLKLRDFQNLGHQVVLIIGDFTGTIGDTSDKESERPMLSKETIEENIKTYKDQAGKILDMSKVEFHYNSEWLNNLTYPEIGFQADQFSVNEFIKRELIKKRLDAGGRVSLREMLYPLMQGYDSVKIHSDVELGGTDQKFNILAGREMQRAYNQEPQNIILNELIAGTDGRKMSSSWGNTINLLEEPEVMYREMMKTNDDLIVLYATALTRIPMEEVAKMQTELTDGQNPRDIKMRLAHEIVSMYHGEAKAISAKNNWQIAFQTGGIPENAKRISGCKGKTIQDVVRESGLVESNTKWLELVKSNAVKVLNQDRVLFDPKEIIIENIDIRIGKERFLKIEA